MQHALKTIFLMLVVGICFLRIPSAEAFFTAHPLQVYEHGIQNLNAYRGNPKDLEQTQNLFTQLIEKHPDSPFGYLGMSQLKTLQAYRYGQHYNIKMISEEAMPMALKAMRTGPTITLIHNNYDRFEKIFKVNDDNQDHVRHMLSLFPEKPETYFALADYLSDQGDSEKALEYYKIALRFSIDDKEKLKALQRIAQIYLDQLPDAKLAVEYFEAALAINKNLPSVWESLGIAYFQLQKYDLSAINLKKALDLFNTPELRSRFLQAQQLEYEQKGVNNQNTSLHYQMGNLYYEQGGLANNPSYFQQSILKTAP